MNRYETYKDSGIPWLGEIPEHWIIMPIKFSLSMPITDGPHETPEILSDGIPFISAEAVKNDKLDFNKKRGYISEEDNVRFSKKYSPKKGDIYMVKSGATTGNVAKVETDEVFNIWSPLAVMRPDKNRISTEFLFYAIKSDYFNTSVQLKWNMGTQQNIGMGILSNIRVVVPPTDEQTAIAQYLDTKLGEIDALIGKQQTLLEKLAEQRTAVITHAVTKGLNPAAPMKNSGVEWLGDVPAHWDVKRLKNSINCSKNGIWGDEEKFDENDMYCLRVADFNRTNFTISETNLTIRNINSKDYENRKLKKGDLLLEKSGGGDKQPVGFVVLNTVARKSVCSNFIAQLKLAENMNAQFWVYFHQFLYSLRINVRSIKQSTGIQNLDETLYFNELACYPPFKEQTAIADYLDQETAKIDRLCDTVNQTIGRLKEYRTALITQTVTGKIKVTDE
jgi:hypothetical protein